jgi:hypothetical protein
MENTLRDLNLIIDDWSGRGVIVKYQLLTDSWIFIAIVGRMKRQMLRLAESLRDPEARPRALGKKILP